MRLGRSRPCGQRCQLWLRHATAFNFIEGMHFNKQFAVGFQPLRAMTDEALRIRSTKTFSSPNVIIMKSKRVPWGEVCTNILLNVVNIPGLRLAPAGGPCDGCRREIYACASETHAPLTGGYKNFRVHSRIRMWAPPI